MSQPLSIGDLNRKEKASRSSSHIYTSTKFCNFDAVHEEIIRDRIVVGIRDHKLSGRKQPDPDLTFENATKKMLQSEMVKDQQTRLD